MTDVGELIHLSYSSKAHAYRVKREGDKSARRAKGVTTLAKITDDKTALDRWGKRMVAVGMSSRPDLVERVAADYDDKSELDDIAEEALTAARAHEAAGRGTAAHRIAERIDLEEMVIDTPFARQVAAAWAKALDDAGLEVIPEYVERVICYPGVPLCGTFDRIFRRKFDGRLVIGDIKTGARALQYPHAIAIQLALYADAPILAGKIDATGKTAEFKAMPSVDRRVGYVVAMPNDETTVEVRTIDIAAGWEAAQNLVFPILDWRARTDLVGTAMTSSSLTPHTDSIKGRLGILKMVDGARERVARSWPEGVPTKPPWSEDEGNAINGVLTDVELSLGVPF